jgi:hypothetical protein
MLAAVYSCDSSMRQSSIAPALLSRCPCRDRTLTIHCCHPFADRAIRSIPTILKAL